MAPRYPGGFVRSIPGYPDDEERLLQLLSEWELLPVLNPQSAEYA